jgi:hydrogenase maturation protein HypF
MQCSGPRHLSQSTKIRHRRWISAATPVSSVGFARLSRGIPLANWLRSQPIHVRIFHFEHGLRGRSSTVNLAPERQRIETAIPFEPIAGFEMVHSETRDDRRVSIPPDLPLCPDCVRELRDPVDRRFGYPFTNCTNCGPRFTIATAAPYERPKTTMAGFRMCPACQREYDSKENRRFHAQPNACPACGPRLSLVHGDGTPLPTQDPIGEAAAALRDGRIVALKGIGGFHLACDATSAGAVAELRRRKGRDEKPFAVMARDMDAARRLCVLTQEEERLLTSVERPVVLAERREASNLSEGVAPANPLLGLLLPYSPLHQLLLDRVDAPLVMTSGNVSDEPIAYTDEEAATIRSCV